MCFLIYSPQVFFCLINIISKLEYYRNTELPKFWLRSSAGNYFELFLHQAAAPEIRSTYAWQSQREEMQSRDSFLLFSQNRILFKNMPPNFVTMSLSERAVMFLFRALNFQFVSCAAAMLQSSASYQAPSKVFRLHPGGMIRQAQSSGSTGEKLLSQLGRACRTRLTLLPRLLPGRWPINYKSFFKTDLRLATFFPTQTGKTG